jgi:fused signal recognition particle receptor
VVDAEVLDELEEALIMSDVGVATTVEIIKRIENRVAKDKYLGTSDLNSILQEEMVNVLTDAPSQEYQNFELPANKKTLCHFSCRRKRCRKKPPLSEKLAYNFKNSGKKVMLGAADTFRAAAVDQLTIWSQRVGRRNSKKKKWVATLLQLHLTV